MLSYSVLSSGICDVWGWWGCALLLVANCCACDDVGVRVWDLVGTEVMSQDTHSHCHMWVHGVTSEYSLWVGALGLELQEGVEVVRSGICLSHWVSPIYGMVSLCLWQDWSTTPHAPKLIHHGSLQIQLLFLVLASPGWILHILYKVWGKEIRVSVVLDVSCEVYCSLKLRNPLRVWSTEAKPNPTS